MSEVMEWTNEQVIRLINSYKARGMLWDPEHDLYRVQTAKYEAWCELAELYGCEITDLRKKFNSILASHRREKAKIRMGGKSTWFAYTHLSFLPNHLSYEGFTNTLDKFTKKDPVEEPVEVEVPVEEPDEEPLSDLEEYDDNGSNSPINIIIKEERELTPPSPPRIYRTVKASMDDRINKRKLEKEKLNRYAEKREKKRLIESKLLKGSDMYKKKDECDSFGEYIAVSLRKHDERTRSMIKQAINNILFEQEMKKYNSGAGQYTVIYAENEVNPLIVPEDCENNSN